MMKVRSSETFANPEPRASSSVIADQKTEDYLKGMDKHHVDRALIMSNYGYPDSAQPFTLNPLVTDSAQSSDRLFPCRYL